MIKLFRFLKLTLIFVLLLSLAAPSLSHASWGDATKPGWKEDKAAHGWIQSKIQHMTLEEKIGQLFIVHVYGETAEDPNREITNLSTNRGGKNFKEVIENYHIGGVIYFNWTDNIGMPIDLAQVNNLSNELQEIAMDQRMEIPLLISTDQEGGIVARVREPGSVFPGNMALGATRSTEYASQTAQIMGQELKSLGINTNLAPVLDVNVNPDNPVIGVRSFSEDPQLVGDMGVAQVEGYQDQNVLATAKHFPGHGDTNVDSHYGLPIINHDLETLHDVDIKPFKDAIDAGIDAIMPAHIVVPALDDSGLPATLSKPILTDLLRDELGFDGLVITDSLGMSGANVVPEDRVAIEAFKAGVDVLLNPPNVELAYNAMLGAVESGELSESRVEESVYRILEAKFKRGLFHNPTVAEDAIENIGLEENKAIAKEMTENSITLLKNEDDVLPLTNDRNILVTGPSSGNPNDLSNLLSDQGIAIDSYQTYNSPSTAQRNAAVEKADDADVIVVTAHSANINYAQQQFVKALQETDKPVVVVSMRNPYDIISFPSVEANVLTYGNQSVSTVAVAKVLIGEVNPSGQLPVTIPGLYEFGDGISY